MNKTKLLAIAVIGLLLLNFGILGMMFFHHPERGPGGPPPMGGPNEGPKKIIIEKLHFDANQQSQYEVLINEHKSKMESLHSESKNLKEELYNLLKDEKTDSIKINSVIHRIGENQQSIENINFDHFSKIKAICKEEQLNDFNHLVDELTELFGPGQPRR